MDRVTFPPRAACNITSLADAAALPEPAHGRGVTLPRAARFRTPPTGASGGLAEGRLADVRAPPAVIHHSTTQHVSMNTSAWLTVAHESHVRAKPAIFTPDSRHPCHACPPVGQLQREAHL